MNLVSITDRNGKGWLIDKDRLISVLPSGSNTTIYLKGARRCVILEISEGTWEVISQIHKGKE